MSFKNKKKGKLKKFNLFDKRDKLQKAAFLMEKERFHEAVEFLEEAVKKYPNEAEFWEFLAFASSETGDLTKVQEAFTKMTELKPEIFEGWMGLASTYALSGRVALAYQTFQEIITRFPEYESIKEVYESRDLIKGELQRIFKEYDFKFNDKYLAIAFQHETVQVLLDQERFEDALRTARELLKLKPDFVPALNNLSLVFYMQGEIEEASETARKVLEMKPDNFHALSNLVRFLVFLGKKDEAEDYAERLRNLKSENTDIFVKKIEAFSFLGDDQTVVEIYQESNDLPSEFMIPISYPKHLAAFAFYRLGDEKKAEQMWEEIIEEDIDFDYSERNLEQLDLPEHNRDVFGLPLQFWIPRASFEKLIKATSKVKDGQNFNKNLQETLRKFFDENPGFYKIIPVLFERSDYSAKDFAIKLLDWAETPEALKILEDFAFSQTGSDELRYTAAQTLSRLDVISNKVKMWQGGELKDLILMSFEITDEITDPHPMKPKAQDFQRKGLIAMKSQNLELAEQYFQKALETNGEHPSLLYNLLAVDQEKGIEKDTEKQLKEIIKKFPDYSFAPISLATIYARQGKIEEAKKLTKRFYEKKKWHYSEIKVWFYFNLECALAEKQFDSARTSMEILAEFDENFDYDYWEDQIKNLELLEKL